MAVLFRDARVHSPAVPDATALLVDDGVVAWVGADPDAVSLGGADRTVRCRGAFLSPAFVDAHVHLTATGLALDGLDLSGARSLDECLAAVAAFAAGRRGSVLIGSGWDDSRWPERRPPTAAELDRATGGAPVYLGRVDAHGAVVSAALAVRLGTGGAGATAATSGPGGTCGTAPAAGSRLAGSTAGFTAGFTAGTAHDRVRAALFAALPAAQRRDAVRRARSHAAGRGVGQVHEMAGPVGGTASHLEDLLRLAAGELGPQVVAYWGALGDLAAVDRLDLPGGGGDLFLDGSLGSRTAALHDPYLPDPYLNTDRSVRPGARGELTYDLPTVTGHVLACLAAGRQPGFHAIGDRAVDLALDAFEAAAAQAGAAALARCRPRLEHAEMCSPRAVARMASLGVTASVQPAFDDRWGGPAGMYASRLGADRAATLNPFAAFATAGVAMAFGSDAPVTPIDPWGGVRAAARHRSAGSSLSGRAAFAAATRGGWRAVGPRGRPAAAAGPGDAGEELGGLLVPGAPASFALWETGPLTVRAPDERVSRWSTDPRGGVPGLPELDGPDPVCVATVVLGTAVHHRTVTRSGARIETWG